jgi:glucose-6-phosphate dehydrogenase assembly protein OpcA
MTNGAAPLNERTQVDIRAIERELNELWRQSTEGHPDAVTRVCVLNLVVPVSDRAASERVSEVVIRLMTRHPNRAIVAVCEPQTSDDLLDAWVQANCQLPSPGRPQVCCEQITITAHGRAVARVPGTILPLLVPDVPVALWWPQGDPFDDVLFRKLASLADRVIVDSASFGTVTAGLRRMAGLLGGQMRLSDLAWGRLTPWREVIAQFFDAPAMVPHLAEIEHLTVDYESGTDGAHGQVEALLLVAWFAARLGWSPEGTAGQDVAPLVRRLRRTDGAAVVAELRAVPLRDHLAGRLAGITITSARARFQVTRDSAPGCALARSEGAGLEPLQRVVRLDLANEADLIAEELRLLGHDRGYEGTLRAAVGLV